MDIRYLGPLEVLDEGRPQPLGGPKQRLVLAHLLIDADRTVPAERLIDRVWIDDPPAAARTSLHSYVSNLRRIVGPERIVSRGHGYALDTDGVRIDRREFDELVARGRRLLPTDPSEASRLLRTALGLWRGPAFADLADERSLAGEIARLTDLRLAVLDDRVAADLACGRARELVGELRALTHAHPLYEHFWAHLMVALYRSGRQGDALAAFTAARGVLTEELGVDPSPELVRLQQQILRHDDVLDAGAPALRGYRLMERIGSGRSAIVWRARQPGVARIVALKALRPQLANSPHFVRRFDAEARAVARVEHPHVVPLYDFWREPDGAFLAMRYLSGGDVADLLEHGEPRTPAVALDIVEQAATAVGAAHRLGVVHGNLKPSNILLDQDRSAYVSDFSIAGAGHATAGPHVAPECRDGATAGPAADVYALGVLLRELAASADGTVADVVARATSVDPADRHADATAFVTALRAIAPATAGPDDTPIPIRLDGGERAIRNPYKGLRAFSEDDAPDFFGRDAFVDRLVARLADAEAGRFVAVVGPSGSGKSSAVRAGVIPALRRGALDGSADWYVAQMLPGRDPFAELATALHPLAVDPPDDLATLADGDDSLDATLGAILPDDHPVVLLIDQFEELFTQVDDADRRARFLRLIADAVSDPDGRVRIVVTLRADYYDRPLRAPAIADLVRADTEAVVPLTAAELERAVTGPAEGVGVAVDRDLVAQLVADVAAEPAGLPLLQYALTEVFEQRSDGRLTLDAYRATGGITGALTRRADAELDRLPPTGREAARQLFLRLVTPADGGSAGIADDTGPSGNGRTGDGSVGDTRRRVPVAEVTALAPETLPAVVTAFGDARLLTFDRDPHSREPTVEVAHEALLREWRRLRGWIDAARDDLRVRQRLTVAASDWDAADRDPSFLARGRRLDRYERWRDESGLTPSPTEAAFLDASLAARDAARAEEAARADRERDLERRSVRRLRALAAVLGVAALIAGALTIFAVTQARRAGDQAQVATARELAAAAAASLDTDPERSILLAREAVRRTREAGSAVQPEVTTVLHRAIGASRIRLSVSGIGAWVDWSPAGDLFVTEGPEEEGIIDLRDASTGESVRSWVGHDADINCAVFSPDGQMLATTDDAGGLKVWDTASGAEVGGFASPDGGSVWRATFSPDGDLVAGAWRHQNVARVIDVATGDVVQEVAVDDAGSVSFSPDGRRLAISEGAALSGTRSVFVADVATGEVVLTLADVAEGVQGAAWSPDGRWLAVSSFSPDILLYDATTGELRHTLTGHASAVYEVAWNDDGTRLASASDDGTTKVWELTAGGGREVLSLTAFGTAVGVQRAVFSPDGTRVLAGDIFTTTAVIWDIRDVATAEGAVIQTFAEFPQQFEPTRIAVMPDGVVAVLDPAGGVGIWDLSAGTRERTIGGDLGPLDMLAVAGEGRWVAAATNAGRVTTWDARTGERVATVEVPTGINSLAGSANSGLFAVTDLSGEGDGGTTRVFDAEGDERAALAAPGRELIRSAIDPDGRLVAVTSTSSERLMQTRVDIWDLADRRVVRTVPGDASGLDFDDDGDRLVTGAPDSGVVVWDVADGDIAVRLLGGTGLSGSTTFSSDGSRIATTTFGGSVRIWDAASGVDLGAVQQSGPIVVNAAFSSDGTRLVTADEAGTVREWLLDLDDLLALADDRLTRELTDEECRQYLRGDGCEAQ